MKLQLHENYRDIIKTMAKARTKKESKEI